MNYILIFTTCKDLKEADLLSSKLLDEKLAACISSHPVTSTYSWKGKIAKGKEIVLIIKTRSSLYKKLEGRIKELHSYENPEIIAVDIITGSPQYLKWMDEVTEQTKKA